MYSADRALIWISAALMAAVAVYGATGCSAQQIVGGSAVVSETVLPAADLQRIRGICASAEPPLTTASQSTNKAVAATAQYGVAYCQALGAAPAGWVPATTTSTTLAWLQTVIQLAGIILPLVL
jgi:hypothetical protein